MERKRTPQCHLKLEHIECHVHWKLKNTAMHSSITQDIIYLFSFKSPLFFIEKRFMALRTLGQASRRMDYGFDFYNARCNTSGPLAPSSHEMRYNPFLGSMNPKPQKFRKQRGRSVEGGKYEW